MDVYEVYPLLLPLLLATNFFSKFDFFSHYFVDENLEVRSLFSRTSDPRKITRLKLQLCCSTQKSRVKGQEVGRTLGEFVELTGY